MRPALLNPLFAPVTTLPGVGPKQDKLLRYLLGRDETPRLVDLLLHLPASVIDRRARPKIRDAVPGTVVTLEVTVDRHRPPPPRNSRAPYLVYASDDTGDVVLTFFRAKPGYVEKLLPVGEKRYVSGTLQMYDGIPQIVHPDRVVDEAGFAKLPRHRSGLSADRRPGARLAAPRDRAGAAKAAGSAGMDQPGSHPPLQLPADRRGAEPRACAGRTRPTSCPMARSGRGSPSTNCWPANWRWRWCARSCAARPATAMPATAICASKIIDALPYALTASQREAVAAITEDLRQPVRMLRLLQGDVGSGKTVVALLAAAAVDRGRQAGRADGADRNPGAPAHQDHRAAGRARRHAGGDPHRPREGQGAPRNPGRLEAGEIDFLVGTHALIQDDVIFKALALAVVDEQHRFGVRERLALTNKGEAVDVLVLSATPIPRTLVLTYFGDMDVSELREKPAGRQPIDTRTVPMSRLDEVIDGVGRALKAGKLVYWICPLVEESEAEGIEHLTNATERFESAAAALWRHGRPRPRPDEGHREGPRDGAIRRRTRSGFWSRPPWSRSASTSPPRPSW